MVSIRPLLLALLLPTVACGGGDEGGEEPTGTHYTYVASSVSVPTSANQGREYGLDLNGDGLVDNRIADALGLLVSAGRLDIQGTLTTAVNQGAVILLADLQTPSFTSAKGAGFAVKIGATPTPAPCSSPTDTVCGNHLKGTGTFTIAAGSPENAEVNGQVAGGTFTGGPGNIALQIALGGSTPIQLDLVGARVKATGMSETGIDSLIIAGALPKSDLDSKVLPVIQAQIAPLIARDCPPPNTPPGCGCAANSTGATLLTLLDTETPRNCTVTLNELKNNATLSAVLGPDVTINGVPALSIGVKLKAVKATFPTK